MIRMPEALVDKVFEAFCAVLPAGVVMEKGHNGISAEAEEVPGVSEWQHSGLGYRGVHLAPLPFLSQNQRAELGLEGFVATLAHLVSNVIPDQPWPAKGSKPHVAIADDVVSIWFGPSEDAGAHVKLQEVPWSGPLTA